MQEEGSHWILRIFGGLFFGGIAFVLASIMWGFPLAWGAGFGIIIGLLCLFFGRRFMRCLTEILIGADNR